MEVILTEDVPKLGNAGQVVRVKPGFARNYLLPRGIALLATRGRIKELEHQRRIVEEKQRKTVAACQEVAKRLEGVALEFEARAGEEGKLFGSVTNADIAGRLAESGVEIDRRKIELPDPLKQVGEYQVPVRLHREVVANVTVRVTALGGPLPEEEAREEEEVPGEAEAPEPSEEEEESEE